MSVIKWKYKEKKMIIRTINKDFYGQMKCKITLKQ